MVVEEIDCLGDAGTTASDFLGRLGVVMAGYSTPPNAQQWGWTAQKDTERCSEYSESITVQVIVNDGWLYDGDHVRSGCVVRRGVVACWKV